MHWSCINFHRLRILRTSLYGGLRPTLLLLALQTSGIEVQYGGELGVNALLRRNLLFDV